MIKNIAFDFGGVIFDLAYERAVETFKKIGLADADQRLDRYHQRGFFEDLESGRITADAFRRQLEPLCHRPLTYEEVQGAWLGYVGNPVDERKLQYLEELRSRGYRTFLLSNTNPYVQAWAESAAQLQAGETLFLDDSPANIAVAEQLGIQTLLVEKNGDWREAVEERLSIS